MAEAKQYTISCGSSLGPAFDGIWVHSNCNANTGSNTGLTGSTFFQVREIEIFEITD
jgi:hypothetical protein